MGVKWVCMHAGTHACIYAVRQTQDGWRWAWAGCTQRGGRGAEWRAKRAGSLGAAHRRCAGAESMGAECSSRRGSPPPADTRWGRAEQRSRVRRAPAGCTSSGRRRAPPPPPQHRYRRHFGRQPLLHPSGPADMTDLTGGRGPPHFHRGGRNRAKSQFLSECAMSVPAACEVSCQTP